MEGVVQESSLAHYMHLSQREASADVVNASILMASSSEKRPAQAQESRPAPPQVSTLPSLPYPLVLLSFCLLFNSHVTFVWTTGSRLCWLMRLPYGQGSMVWGTCDMLQAPCEARIIRAGPK